MSTTPSPRVTNEERAALYVVGPSFDLVTQAQDATIRDALAILAGRLKAGPIMDGPQVVKDYLVLWLAPAEYEQFAVLFLDVQHRIIDKRIMFTGTLTQTSVYPREVVKAALKVNAGAVILAHNHPSGNAEPSRADECLTNTLKSALALVDVRVLDHVVVSATGTCSMAQRGLL